MEHPTTTSYRMSHTLTPISTTPTGITMSYLRSLTFNLRLRGMSEDDIAEVLDAVQAHEAATGAPAKAEFGTAEEYAKQFPKKKRQTRGHTITVVGAALAIAYILLTILLMFFRIDIRDYVGPITLMPAFLMLLVSTVAGFLTDYFRPAQRSQARHGHDGLSAGR